MSSLLILATSKVPFYIAGGAFAIWAVILSAIGLNNPTFPANFGGQRIVILISATLMVLAIAMAIATA